MGCTWMHFTASGLMFLALLLVCCSFDPKYAGGFMKIQPKEDSVAKRAELHGEGWFFDELLVHATYISVRKKLDTAGAVQEPDDAWCKTLFKQGAATPGSQAEDGSLRGGGFYKDNDVSIPCVVTILTATRRPLMSKRYYASFIFGCAYDEPNTEWNCHGSRTFFDDTMGYGLNAPLLPNTFATQDSVFRLVQLSGGSLVLGVICHVLAFLLGGFIWNYKDCCDWGVCSFLFNSLVYAYGSLLFYIISACAFASVYLQGDENDDDELLKIKWSTGGILLLCGIFIEIIGLSLASYAFYKDAQEAREREVTQVLKEEGVLREVVPPANDI